MCHNIIFGDPDQQLEFQTRNRQFFERFSNFKDALDTAFIRSATVTTAAVKAIYFLGRLCIEDFMEIICLAANGYGIGAMKLVRGLYERAVTASYLSLHPEEAEAFWNWRFVSRYKTIHAYVAGGSPGEDWILKERQMRADFNQHKGNYEVNDCKKCGTKRINNTWRTLDFACMARKTGPLGMLLGQAYYVPLNHSHCTSEALMARLAATDQGEIEFKSEPQPKDADVALQLAHTIMLSLLEVQYKHFSLDELREKVELCENDHVKIWSERDLGQDPMKL